jgi:hypothetical protein
MNFAVTPRQFACALLAVSCGLAAANSADQKIDVRVILERNPFNLKAPEPPPPPPAPPEAPKTVKLSGIVSIIGPPRALLVRQEAGQAKPDYLTMREGEKDGTIEVLRIDAAAGEVEISNGGLKRVLTFKDDGLKPAGPAPATAGVPGAGGAGPGAGFVVTGAQPSASPVSAWTARAANTGASQGVATTASTLTASQVNPALGASAPGAGANVQADFRATPTRQVRVPLSPQANSQPPTPPKIDPLAQQVIMEANRLNNPSDFPPLPQTDLTPLLPPK